MDTSKFDVDEVDRAILHLLQEDARNNTTTELSEEVGVSSTTVGNRIKRMESDGIINGYYPDIDYERTGLELHLLITGEVPVKERAALTEEALDVVGVITVQEILTGVENLLVEAVALEVSSISRITSEIEDLGIDVTISRITSEIEDLGIDVKNTQILGNRHIKPFDHYGTDVGDED